MTQNSDPVPKKRKQRGKGRPFAKGGDSRRNAGGVPPEVRAIKEAMAVKGERLIELLIASAEAGSVPAQIRCVEYVLGKPKELVELTGQDGRPIESESRVEVRRHESEPDWTSATARLLVSVGIFPAQRLEGGVGQTVDAKAQQVHPAEATPTAGGIPSSS